ncbi:hypothetical protein M9H77_31782 [Catharanthus roseus]|uniref:Uncharacterized protein n=1 Tax=Catharanthus roseus TaxID=4058 RepID=A0ACC0A101_CATRO|nr:hypothetical protein M9H77_31782 [Catharanthus roseus]
MKLLRVSYLRKKSVLYIGNPIFLEPFWRQNAENSAILVAGRNRMGYEFEDGSLISKEIEKQFRKLHAAVGNAITEDRYIVLGAGSTQLLNAAVYALSSDHDGSSSHAKVVASAPYFPVIFKFFDKFNEFVTSPDNPDGQLKKAVLEGPFANQTYDLAYYWPQYTPIPSTVDEDLMLFTLSKLTCHAGSRFGWALIKDKAVYERMMNYMDLNTYGVPRETQLRALRLLKVVLEGNGRNMFDFWYKTMQQRREKLIRTFSASERF